jgi:hypothetical protein
MEWLKDRQTMEWLKERQTMEWLKERQTMEWLKERQTMEWLKESLTFLDNRVHCFCGIHIAQSLVFCVVVCISLFFLSTLFF